MTSLIKAVNLNKLNTVKRELSDGADPNLQNERGHTSLHIASLKNKPEIVAELLLYGADPNIQDTIGASPFLMFITLKPFDWFVYNYEKTAGVTTTQSVVLKRFQIDENKMRCIELLMFYSEFTTDVMVFLDYITNKSDLINLYIDIWNPDNILLRSRESPNITFNLGDNEISANKEVLTNQSEFFKSKFSDRWKQEDLILNEENNAWEYPEAFQAIVDFIETGNVGEITQQVALDILPASGYYDLNEDELFDKQVARALLRNFRELQNDEVKDYIKQNFPENHWWHEIL